MRRNFFSFCLSLSVLGLALWTPQVFSAPLAPSVPSAACDVTPRAAMLVPTPTNVRLICLRGYPTGLRVAVVWETATELDNAGFYVARADAPEGPWNEAARIGDFVPSEGGTTGARYEMADTQVSANHTYYYRIESINTSNQSDYQPEVAVSVLVTGTGGATATTQAATATRTATATPLVVTVTYTPVPATTVPATSGASATPVTPSATVPPGTTVSATATSQAATATRTATTAATTQAATATATKAGATAVPPTATVGVGVPSNTPNSAPSATKPAPIASPAVSETPEKPSATPPSDATTEPPTPGQGGPDPSDLTPGAPTALAQVTPTTSGAAATSTPRAMPAATRVTGTGGATELPWPLIAIAVGCVFVFGFIALVAFAIWRGRQVT